MQWNDNMDEAPRDGREVLAFSVTGFYEMGSFDKDGTFHSVIDDVAIEVIHWMHLPEPPR